LRTKTCWKKPNQPEEKNVSPFFLNRVILTLIRFR
jgi:hypothetical protein